MAKGCSCHRILLTGIGDKRKNLAIAGYLPIGGTLHSVATKLFAVETCFLCTKS